MKDVVIGDDVWFGCNYTTSGENRGNHASKDGGFKDMPELVVADGSPVEVVQFRNKEHFKMRRDDY